MSTTEAGTQPGQRRVPNQEMPGVSLEQHLATHGTSTGHLLAFQGDRRTMTRQFRIRPGTLGSSSVPLSHQTQLLAADTVVPGAAVRMQRVAVRRAAALPVFCQQQQRALLLCSRCGCKRWCVTLPSALARAAARLRLAIPGAGSGTARKRYVFAETVAKCGGSVYAGAGYCCSVRGAKFAGCTLARAWCERSVHR
jgi:hypothetical protein